MRFEIPFAAKPKARPRVTNGTTYMPKDYTDWKERVAELIGYSGLRKQAMKGDVSIDLVFMPDRVEVSILPSMFSRHGRADLDNLAGGVLDALQDAGLIANDRDVVELRAVFAPEERNDDGQ